MQLEIGECFESINDALRALVAALGGTKKVGGMLWPALPLDDASAKVRHCLNDGRREKFDIDEVLLLLRRGREVGFHAGMDFIAADTGYKAAPVDAKRQVEDLESRIANGIDSLNASMAHLAKLRERLAQQ